MRHPAPQVPAGSGTCRTGGAIGRTGDSRSMTVTGTPAMTGWKTRPPYPSPMIVTGPAALRRCFLSERP